MKKLEIVDFWHQKDGKFRRVPLQVENLPQTLFSLYFSDTFLHLFMFREAETIK